MRRRLRPWLRTAWTTAQKPMGEGCWERDRPRATLGRDPSLGLVQLIDVGECVGEVSEAG